MGATEGPMAPVTDLELGLGRVGTMGGPGAVAVVAPGAFTAGQAVIAVASKAAANWGAGTKRLPPAVHWCGNEPLLLIATWQALGRRGRTPTASAYFELRCKTGDGAFCGRYTRRHRPDQL